MLLPTAVNIINYCLNLKFNYDLINDELSLFQLRRIMLIAYDAENNGDELHFVYHNDEYSLSLINNRLVLQPGYQMFLNSVDYIDFVEEGNTIFINYVKNEKEYSTPIVKAKGIYIDDFLDNNDELDEPSIGDE